MIKEQERLADEIKDRGTLKDYEDDLKEMARDAIRVEPPNEIRDGDPGDEMPG